MLPIIISIAVYSCYNFIVKKIHKPIVIFFLTNLMSALLIAKRGSSWNMFLPLTLGLSLTCGIGLKESSKSMRQFMYFLFIIQLLMLAIFNPLHLKHPTDEHFKAGYKVLEYIKKYPGPLLGEQFESFANHFKKQIFVEGDLGYELYACKKWNPEKLLEDIANHRFSLVLYTGQGGFIKPFKDKLRKHYVPIDQFPVGLYSGQRVLFILVPGKN